MRRAKEKSAATNGASKNIEQIDGESNHSVISIPLTDDFLACALCKVGDHSKHLITSFAMACRERVCIAPFNIYVRCDCPGSPASEVA